MRTVAAVWILGWVVANAFAIVAMIGKDRDPVTPGTAVVVLIVDVSMAVATVELW